MSADEETIERVARAIYAARIKGGKSYAEFDQLISLGFERDYDNLMRDARAALESQPWHHCEHCNPDTGMRWRPEGK